MSNLQGEPKLENSQSEANSLQKALVKARWAVAVAFVLVPPAAGLVAAEMRYGPKDLAPHNFIARLLDGESPRNAVVNTILDSNIQPEAQTAAASWFRSVKDLNTSSVSALFSGVLASPIELDKVVMEEDPKAQKNIATEFLMNQTRSLRFYQLTESSSFQEQFTHVKDHQKTPLDKLHDSQTPEYYNEYIALLKSKNQSGKAESLRQAIEQFPPNEKEYLRRISGYLYLNEQANLPTNVDPLIEIINKISTYSQAERRLLETTLLEDGFYFSFGYDPSLVINYADWLSNHKVYGSYLDVNGEVSYFKPLQNMFSDIAFSVSGSPEPIDLLLNNPQNYTPAIEYFRGKMHEDELTALLASAKILDIIYYQEPESIKTMPSDDTQFESWLKSRRIYSSLEGMSPEVLVTFARSKGIPSLDRPETQNLLVEATKLGKDYPWINSQNIYELFLTFDPKQVELLIKVVNNYISSEDILNLTPTKKDQIADILVETLERVTADIITASDYEAYNIHPSPDFLKEGIFAFKIDDLRVVNNPPQAPIEGKEKSDKLRFQGSFIMEDPDNGFFGFDTNGERYGAEDFHLFKSHETNTIPEKLDSLHFLLINSKGEKFVRQLTSEEKSFSSADEVMTNLQQEGYVYMQRIIPALTPEGTLNSDRYVKYVNSYDSPAILYIYDKGSSRIKTMYLFVLVQDEVSNDLEKITKILGPDEAFNFALSDYGRGSGFILPGDKKFLTTTPDATNLRAIEFDLDQ